jgi:glycosyltransferase involved in cell wall biosynthesis
VNILLITSLYPGYIGQSRRNATYALHNFAKEWVKAGHNVLVCRLWVSYPGIFNVFPESRYENKYAYLEKFKVDNVPVYRCPMKKIPRLILSKNDISKASELIIDILDKENFNPDIILAHMLNPGGLVSFKVKESVNVPLVLGIHHSDLNSVKQKKIMRVVWESNNKIDMYAFRSYSLFKAYERDLRNRYLPEKRYFLALSGIDEKEIIFEHVLKNKINRPIKNIITVCNLIPLKNVDVLIEAFTRLEVRYDFGLELKIIGDGPEKKKLISLSRKLKMDNKINFLGEKSHEKVLEFMKESDIFAMASSPETFGLVYLEAMASGCITIGSKGEGIDGIIKDGENGFLCEPRSVVSLEEKLLKAVKMTPPDKEKMLFKARESVVNMTNERVADLYIKKIKEIVEEK